MQHDLLNLVFWANHLDEFAATTFVTELRRIGLPVKIVGIHRQTATGSFGMRLLPDLSLEEAAPHFHQVGCMIFPGSTERLQAMCQHPRLNELLASVTSHNRLLVTVTSDSRQSPIDWSNLLICPTDERIIAFAKRLAQRLTTETQLPQSNNPLVLQSTKGTTLPARQQMEAMNTDTILYVAGQSRPHAVATAIVCQLREQRQSNLQAIGAGAVYQMVKAVISAQRFLQNDGISLICTPSYVKTDADTNVHTAVRFKIQSQNGAIQAI